MTSVTFVFRKNDRVLIVAAHPDDEALAAAGIIQKARVAGARIKVIYLTHGDGNMLAGIFHLKKPIMTRKIRAKMADGRKNEATQAMKGLDVKRGDLVFLGHPDLGLMALWRKKRAHVVDGLAAKMALFDPTLILAPAGFDRHSDHQAAGYFIQAALEKGGGSFVPKVLSYLIHSSHWPHPKGYKPEEFLMPPKKWTNKKNWLTVHLSPAERKKKYEALLCYNSQMSYSRNFLLSFARRNELFCTY